MGTPPDSRETDQFYQVLGGRGAAFRRLIALEYRGGLEHDTGMKLLTLLIVLVLPVAAQNVDARLAKEINHELTMLPYYGVFDNLGFKVQDREVTLVGQVREPQLKSRAEQAVREVNGVEVVRNQIEVLPNSPNDDRLRIALYNAIYSKPALQRYQLMAVPAIHILVKNGEVTLEGWVATELDRNVAGTSANTVGGVRKVTNNLKVENPR
jgi:hyperosmotically inducible protein